MSSLIGLANLHSRQSDTTKHIPIVLKPWHEVRSKHNMNEPSISRQSDTICSLVRQDVHLHTHVYNTVSGGGVKFDSRDKPTSERLSSEDYKSALTSSLSQILNQAKQIEWKNLNCFLNTILIDMEAFDLARSAKQKTASDTRTPQTICSSSYPLKIHQVSELGPTSLYMEWCVFERECIDMIIILVDGQLVKKYYSGNVCKTVLCDINVQRMHLIALKAIPKMERTAFMEQFRKVIQESGLTLRFEEVAGKRVTTDVPKPIVDTKFWRDSTYVYVPQKRRIIIV